MNKIMLYCRQGFEKEMAAEIMEKAATVGVAGFARAVENTAYVIFECYQPNDADLLAQKLPVKELIFARQLLVISDLLEDLSPDDRITPIIEAFKQLPAPFDLTKTDDIWVESADTNEAKSLLTFCRKFTVPLRQALRKAGALQAKVAKHARTLHVFFLRNNACYVGYSYNQQHSPYFMGIQRLRFPEMAPSRSTLKLEEAILTFFTPEEEKARFNENQIGVDLGACPGGWTYQLVKRGVFVYAVDHGKMAASLFDTGRIEHCPEDGFKFQPPKRKRVNWLVCDMVEKPSRIADLMAKWLVNGWTQEAIFNLKLPMKKRYQEVQQCLDSIAKQLQDAGFSFQIQAKQLYHDREEITVHARVK